MDRLILGSLALCAAFVIQSGCTSDSSSGGADDPVETSLDEDVGIRCATNPGGGNFTTYYFKSGMFRTESSFTVPGVTSYDIQPNADDYYKVTLDATNCGALRIDPTQSYEEWKQGVIGAYEAQKGTPGASQPGAPQCEQMALADDLFAIPEGCTIN